MVSSTHNKQIYQSLIDNMTEGFAQCQMIYKNNKPIDFIYLEVNLAFEKLTGLKNIVGKRISESLVNHRTENPKLFNLYERVSKTQVPEKMEVFVAPLKRWFSISAYSCQKGQFLVFFDNITMRKEQEKKILDITTQWQSTFDSVNDAIWLLDNDQQVLRFNKKAAQLFGKDCIGKFCHEIIHNTDVPIENCPVQLACIHKCNTNTELQIGNKWYNISADPIFDEKRNIISTVHIVRDINTRKKAEHKLIKKEQNLSDLNSTKDKLISIIAHDLRGPFNNILGFSELLIKNVNNYDVAKFEKYLGIINSSTQNTLVLLDNLLDWAKSQTGQISFNPKKLLFSKIIQEMIKLKDSHAKSKDISLNYSSLDEIEVFADENMLKTILRNLISNAIKFTEKGGQININAILKQNHVEISISDNGIGMDENTLKELFKISSKATSHGTANEKGSGLGLVLCKEFIEKHRGEIRVESEEGKGSNFKFILPFNNTIE